MNLKMYSVFSSFIIAVPTYPSSLQASSGDICTRDFLGYVLVMMVCA